MLVTSLTSVVAGCGGLRIGSLSVLDRSDLLALLIRVPVWELCDPRRTGANASSDGGSSPWQPRFGQRAKELHERFWTQGHGPAELA
jgi:hypothetical protein